MRLRQVFLLGLCIMGAADSVSAYHAEEAGMCIDIRPLCPPGTHAECICGDPLAVTCSWFCIAHGRVP